jgi:hypothetical protein
LRGRLGDLGTGANCGTAKTLRGRGGCRRPRKDPPFTISCPSNESTPIDTPLALHVFSCYTIVVHNADRDMKTNITLRIDADLVREAKVLAAQRGTSVSRLLAEHLEDLIRRDRAYEAAKNHALEVLGRGFDLGWRPARSRDELHER